MMKDNIKKKKGNKKQYTTREDTSRNRHDRPYACC